MTLTFTITTSQSSNEVAQWLIDYPQSSITPTDHGYIALDKIKIAKEKKEIGYFIFHINHAILDHNKQFLTEYADGAAIIVTIWSLGKRGSKIHIESHLPTIASCFEELKDAVDQKYNPPTEATQ